MSICIDITIMRDSELANCTEKVPMLSLKDTFYLAKCVKCYDGDTVHLVIRFRGVLTKFACRLLNIDCAEIRSRNKNEKEHAEKSKKYIEEQILGKQVLVQCGNFGKFGRLLVTLFPVGTEHFTFENSINQKLINNCLAYYYDGKKRKKFDEWFHDMPQNKGNANELPTNNAE